MSKSQLRSKKLLGAVQDGSTEFISLVACICADGTTIPPALIYQGESGDLQDTWVNDFDGSRDKAYFAASERGWTSDDLGFSWLTKVFDPNTKEKAGNSKRFLLTDGHSSHVNLRFIEYCDQNNIILAILPPHSTHRLQPLDVGIFGPLGSAYSNEIDQLCQSSKGFSRITKSSFWQLFRAAWESALTKKNIQSAFASPGIHPYNPPKVLNILNNRTPSPISSDNEDKQKTPGSVRAVRRTIKAIRQENTALSGDMQLAIKALEKLSIEKEILEHTQQGLLKALVGEKKSKKRGRPLGLIDKDNPGEAQFFSPEKVKAAQQKIRDIESQKEQEKVEAENRRTQKALEREQKAQEIQERRETRIREREEKRQQKELEKEQRHAAREAKKQENQNKKMLAKQANSKKRVSDEVIESGEEDSSRGPKTVVSRSGREINAPIRFGD